MLTPRCQITIKNKDSGKTLRFTGCNEFAIKRSVEELSATGTVYLPTMITFDSKKRDIIAVRDNVYPGDTITIEAGYIEEGNLHELFNGHVKAVNTGTKTKLDIEEGAFELRKKNLPISILKDSEEKDKTLKSLLGKILDGTGFTLADSCADMSIDEFQHNGNAASALVEIKNKLDLTVYIKKDKTVYAGLEAAELLPSEKSSDATVKLTYGVNIISNDVEYQTKESKPLKVIVKGISADGKESEEHGVAGIDGGDQQTYMKYNVTDKKTLDEIAKQKYNTQSYDGFRGTITIFGIPLATTGGTAVYKNENYSNTAEGSYFIKAVETTLSTGGLRQTLTMGYKLCTSPTNK